MAVGDVVNGVSALSAVLDFQPASGVECLITTFLNSAGDGAVLARFGMTNGSITVFSSSGNATEIITNIHKMFINNSLYLRIALRAGNYNGYTGIQIK